MTFFIPFGIGNPKDMRISQSVMQFHFFLSQLAGIIKKLSFKLDKYIWLLCYAQKNMHGNKSSTQIKLILFCMKLNFPDTLDCTAWECLNLQWVSNKRMIFKMSVSDFLKFFLCYETHCYILPFHLSSLYQAILSNLFAITDFTAWTKMTLYLR